MLWLSHYDNEDLIVFWLLFHAPIRTDTWVGGFVFVIFFPSERCLKHWYDRGVEMGVEEMVLDIILPVQLFTR